MAGLQGNDIKLVTLAEAVETLRTVPEADYEEAKILFG
jgi:hypothetical protein